MTPKHHPTPEEIAEAVAWYESDKCVCLYGGGSSCSCKRDPRGRVLSAALRDAQAELRRQSQELERAREIVRHIGEGHNPHRKCLAPSKCCPKNRLCFPCLANDFLTQPAQKKGEDR